jgi:3-oxoacyl-[acyl-carrier protein] reductase
VTVRDFEGRRILVTAGSRGIGRAIVQAFARAGGAVAFNYLADDAAAIALAGEIGAAGGLAVPVQADATRANAVVAMVGAAERALGGPIDVAIANVGPFRLAPLASMPPVEFDDIVRTNLSSAYYLAHSVVPRMRAGGVLLTIGLAPASDALDGAPHIAAYACAKAALASLTRSMATEYAPAGIRVAMIAPGLIGHEALDPVQARWMAERTPMGRLGTAREIADAALFLASDRASYCAGAVLAVGGGWDWARDRSTRHDSIEVLAAIGPDQVKAGVDAGA